MLEVAADPYRWQQLVVDGELTHDGGTPLARSEVYDPVANAWSTLPALPTGRMALGVSGMGGRLYAIGGRNATAALGTNERFTP